MRASICWVLEVFWGYRFGADCHCSDDYPVLRDEPYLFRPSCLRGRRQPGIARYAGVNVKWVQIRVFLISGLTAALAGVVLAARLYSGQPNVGEGFERDAIAASVLGGTSMGGGVGTLGGTVIGVLIIGVLNNGMNLLRIDTYWQYVVKGVVILGAVYMDYIKRVRAAKK